MGCWTVAPSYQSDLGLGRSLVPSLVAQSYQLAVHSGPMSFPSDGYLELTKDSRKGARSFLLGVHWEKKTASMIVGPSYRVFVHFVQLMGCWSVAPSYQSDLGLGRSLVLS